MVYRMGFASTRAEARQLVRHGHFEVNGRRVNIPSYLVKVNDTISVKEKSKKLERFKEILDVTGAKIVPNWLEVDQENLTGKVAALPAREDIDLQVQEHLIVELYSK